MAYFPTQTDIQMLYQHSKTVHTRLELLNKNFKTVDSLEGAVVSGSISVDASSDIRRTFSAQFVLTDEQYTAAPDTKLWMNNYVRVYLGVTETRTNEVHWYPQGLYVFQSNGFSFDESTRTASASCVDMVAFLDGSLAGALTGRATMIKAYDEETYEPTGTKIRPAIVGVLELFGVDKYNVSYKDAEVPYNMEFDTGVTGWEMLTELRDLYYPYEMFYDDDTFVCKKIPSGEDDPIVISDEVISKLVISEDTSVDYTTVKNVVEVFGQLIEADHFSSDVIFENNTYTLNLTEASIRRRRQFSFIAPENNEADCMLQIVNVTEKDGAVTTGPFPICTYSSDSNTTTNIGAGSIVKGRGYVVEMTEGSYWKFVGQTEVHAMIKLVDNIPTPEEIEQDKVIENCYNMAYASTHDPATTTALSLDEPNIFIDSSPYSIERIGRRNLIIEDDAIYSDELAMARAEYELWKAARLTDSIQLQTTLIPWLEPNQKISYRTKYNSATEEQQYMIQSFSMDLGSYTMSINASRFYPYYPEIVKES